MPRGRLEGWFTVPSGGWTLSATNGTGGPSTVTIAAGTYTTTSYAANLQTQLNTSRPSGWTVTPSFGESGTGLVTINCSSTNWAISWTSTELGSLIGHSNITSRASSLAGGICPAVWMPDCAYWTPYDIGDFGHYVTDVRQTVSPNGYVKTLYGNKMRVLNGVKWPAVINSRVKVFNIGSAYQPFEEFWRTVMLGEVYTSLTAGSPIAFYFNADSSNTSTYRFADLGTFAPPQLVDGWAGRYRVELPRLIEDPT